MPIDDLEKTTPGVGVFVTTLPVTPTSRAPHRATLRSSLAV